MKATLPAWACSGGSLLCGSLWLQLSRVEPEADIRRVTVSSLRLTTGPPASSYPGLLTPQLLDKPQAPEVMASGEWGGTTSHHTGAQKAPSPESLGCLLGQCCVTPGTSLSISEPQEHSMRRLLEALSSPNILLFCETETSSPISRKFSQSIKSLS